MKRVIRHLLPLFLVGAILGGSVVAFINYVRDGVEKSLFRSRATELWNAYRLWVEAGRPGGDELARFAQRFKPSGWVLVDQEQVINGSHYRILFRDPSPPYKGGELCVSGSGVVLWNRNDILIEKSLQ